MTCFKITRSSHDDQLPLAVGVKSDTLQLLDSREKTWWIANFVICEDGGSSPARSREELYEEYLECFRDRINMFNINTVADNEKTTWAHYLELIWLHGACQTVRQYRPELEPMFDSRENKDYPRFDPENDSVDATSMFRPRTLAFGEQAFLTAKYPWTVLIAPAEDIYNMAGFSPAFPLREIYSPSHQWHGLPPHNVHSNRSSIYDTEQQQLYMTSPSYSTPEISPTGVSNRVYPAPEGSKHARTASSGSADTGMQNPHRPPVENYPLQGQAARGPTQEINPSIPAAPKSQIPEHLNCAVQLQIKQIAPDQDVFNTIHTGAIYSYSRVAISNRLSVVDLVFMTRDGAQKYIHMTRNREDMLILNKRVLAIWSKNRVAPCTRPGVSRVLKLTGPLAGCGVLGFRQYARRCGAGDVLSHRECIVGSSREMVLEFSGFRGLAELVFENVVVDPMWKAYRIEYLRDPCDVPEEI
ncbi:hypothetical protein NHQ30_004366 [Ciborinia camelliae]|nr:hypothetical protein NHQ30_004366 [Ciborinia camelliae]